MKILYYEVKYDWTDLFRRKVIVATNCYVGKLNEDNTVDCIFIKFNGHYEDVGADLLKDFNNEYSAHVLITSGNGNTLYDKRKDEPYKMSFEEYDKIFEDTFIEYAYLWKDNQWYGKDCYDKEEGIKGMGYKEFTPLNQILIPIEKKIVEYQLR